MPEIKPYGLTNPYPLSQLKTELVWDGKYDEYGRRREVDIAGSAMPIQKIETGIQNKTDAVHPTRGKKREGYAKQAGTLQG